MHTASVEEVVGRLGRLERENRVMKWTVVLLAAAVVMIGLVGATLKRKPTVVEEIRARRFVLFDQAGKQRGLWAVFRDTVDPEPSTSPVRYSINALAKLRSHLESPMVRSCLATVRH